MNIVLVCMAGMSTSLLQTKLIDEAKSREIDVSVKAVPIADIDDHVTGADILLLGPQVRYLEKKLKKKYSNIPISVIKMTDYGTMNAKNIFDNILAEVKE